MKRIAILIFLMVLFFSYVPVAQVYNSGSNFLTTASCLYWTRVGGMIVPIVASDSLNIRYLAPTARVVTVLDTLRAKTISANLFLTDSAAYASAYIADDHPDTISYTKALEAQAIGKRQGVDPRGCAFTSGCVTKNVVIDDSSLTIVVNGNYEVSWSLNFGDVSGVANPSVFNAYVYINDIKEEKTGVIVKLTNLVNYTNMCCTAMTLSLKKNDVLKLKMVNVDDANGNIIRVLYCRLHVFKHAINNI